MVRTGRFLSALAAVVTLIVLIGSVTPLAGITRESDMVLGLVMVVSIVGIIAAIGAWGLALVHWRKEGDQHLARYLWLAALILANIPASWFYWIIEGGGEHRR